MYVYSAAEEDASLSVCLKEVLPSCRSRGLVPVLEVALVVVIVVIEIN